jgi:hypothetical protein
MPTELYDPNNVFAPAFAFDADLQWAEVHEYELAKRKVEGKGTISDFIASKPESATLEGRVTAMTVDPAPADPNKLVNVRDALVALAAKKADVLVVSELYVGTLVISRAEISKGVSDGHSWNGKISLGKIETTTPGTATVPASRLRAKVKKRAGPPATGGSGATGKKPQSTALKGLLRAGWTPMPLAF